MESYDIGGLQISGLSFNCIWFLAPFFIDGALAIVRSQQQTLLDTDRAADKEEGGPLGFRLREKCRQLRKKWSGCNSREREGVLCFIC